MPKALSRLSDDPRLARPLKELVSLIRQTVAEAKTAASNAAEAAAQPFFQKAGAYLIECKQQVAHGHWEEFIREYFDFSIRTAQSWMTYARELPDYQKRGDAALLGKPPTLTDVDRPNRERSTESREVWRKEVRNITNQINYARQNKEYEDKRKENKARLQLAMQLIDIGFKTLATKLHPDKGGSDEAMHRLSEIRQQLKKCVEATWKS